MRYALIDTHTGEIMHESRRYWNVKADSPVKRARHSRRKKSERYLFEAAFLVFLFICLLAELGWFDFFSHPSVVRMGV